MMKFAQEVEGRANEHRQARTPPIRCRGKPVQDKLLKLLANDGVHQRIFIEKMSIERRTINRRSLGDILNTDRGETFLLQELHKSLLQELARPLDPRVHIFFYRHIHNTISHAMKARTGVLWPTFPTLFLQCCQNNKITKLLIEYHRNHAVVL